MPGEIAFFAILAIGALACLRVIFGELGKDAPQKFSDIINQTKDVALKSGLDLWESNKGGLLEKGKKIATETGLITPQLVEQIFELGAEELLSLVFPKGKNQPIFSDISGKNTYVVTDDDDHPFQITSLISQTTDKVVEGKKTQEEKARVIFDWFQKNIQYDHAGKRPTRGSRPVGYRHAVETFNDRAGVCGEMAILYVVMARHVDLKVNYASVRKDSSGKDVAHACAAVQLKGKSVLVDPAYRTFDIHHEIFTILPDTEAVLHFKTFRG